MQLISASNLDSRNNNSGPKESRNAARFNDGIYQLPTWPRDSLRGLGPSREKLSPNIYLASALLEKSKKKNRKGTRQTDEKDSKERERERVPPSGSTRPQLAVIYAVNLTI